MEKGSISLVLLSSPSPSVSSSGTTIYADKSPTEHDDGNSSGKDSPKMSAEPSVYCSGNDSHLKSLNNGSKKDCSESDNDDSSESEKVPLCCDDKSLKRRASHRAPSPVVRSSYRLVTSATRATHRCRRSHQVLKRHFKNFSNRGRFFPHRGAFSHSF